MLRSLHLRLFSPNHQAVNTINTSPDHGYNKCRFVMLIPCY